MMKLIILVPEDGVDTRITITKPLYGKYDKATLVDNDLSDWFQFLALKREVYIETIIKEYGTKVTKDKVDFKGSQRSMLTNLRIFLVFGTTLATMQCMKLLISRMHGGSFWLDREYPIHVDDIQRLTGLSGIRNAVPMTFQITLKWVKEGDNDYYNKYDTKVGRKGEKIDLINK